MLELIEALRSCKGTEGLLVIPQICLQGIPFPAPSLTVKSWDISADSLVNAGTACQEKEELWKKQGTNNAQQVTRCKQMAEMEKTHTRGLCCLAVLVLLVMGNQQLRLLSLPLMGLPTAGIFKY